MISRIFKEKFRYSAEEDHKYGLQKKKLNHFIIISLIGFLLSVLIFTYTFDTVLWYKAGFYSLIYVGICTFVFIVFLTRELKNATLKQKALEKDVQDLDKALSQARKSETLGLLAGSVAHDLNNILSGMATYPEVLMMDENLDPKLRQGLDIIRDSGQKASEVVRDLLTISCGASAQMEILNVNSVLDHYVTAHDFKKIRKSHAGVVLELVKEPELLNIKGSYIHIEKIIMNLFIHAMAEVSQKEGGKVIIQTANQYVDSFTAECKNIAPDIRSHFTPGEYVVLSVIDNGFGIDKKHIKKIFDPFFIKKQLGKSGTGLGLTVVWNALQDHGGFVNLVSDENGTRFDLLFPATRAEIPQKPDAGSIEEIKGNGQMVLVVEVVKEQQKIAMGILEKLGYRAHAVDNGHAAVDFVQNRPTDLVILDMIMTPSIDGLETYRLIKDIKADQKAIIAIGSIESENAEAALGIGGGSFIKKPYTVLDMGIAIKEELER